MVKNNKVESLAVAVVWEQLEWGGVDSYLGYLLNDWPNKNDKITIFYNAGNKGVLRLKNNIRELSNVSFVEVENYFTHYDMSNWFSRIGKVLTYLMVPVVFLLSAYRYKKLFLEYKPKVVMAQNGGYPGGYGNISAVFGAAWAGISVRILVIHHAAIKPDLFHGWFRLLLEKKLAKYLSSLVAVSAVTKETLIRNTRITDDQKCHVTVINNGIPAPKNTITRKGSAENKVKIGILGRLEAYKGHDDFLCALSMISKECLQQVHVEFIGGYDDKDYQRLKQLTGALGLDDVVVMRGFVDDEVSNIIRGLDLVVMVTKTFEGFGLTVLESLNNNVPVLATKVGIVTEIFPLESDLIVDVGDIQAMVSALELFISSENKDGFIPAKVRNKLWQYDSSYMAKQYRDHMAFERLKAVVSDS